ncbi:Glutamyl-tRNA amidotransferase subunit B, mitochondrial [Favolaschia claudopus]|uniref:Glutamyl-tRNA(Gln) amidotransferase subunit B, mitochondrial n=1 Tax=Favolaschia claudopus TaxID=2862362 RepID=A0AAW0D9J7_9AGAR
MLSLSCQPTNSLARQFRRAFHDKRWPGWQVIIGIETHAQIKSRQKLFSESLTSSLGEPPNIHVSPFDAAFPGTLPRLNQDCVDLALRTAIALNSQIQTRSSFDRKHYFYSDLPSGYQITQHYAPISLSGHLRIPDRESPIRIMQIQLEQDTAKSTFDPRTRTSKIDLNRAGIGLLEIVTEPDLRSPEEAGAYVRALQAVLRAIGASDGNMEAGSLRCDVNVSINPIGKPPGTRCEIKNLNSIKFMQTAIVYEVHRQRDLLSKEGGVVPQETRGFNQDTLETFKMRSKEEAPDYRYMPDPNLGVLVISPDRVQDITQKMPELPWVTRARLVRECKLSEQDADILLNLDAGRDGRSAVAYFDDLCKQSRKPTVVFNWMVHELLGRLHTARLTFADNPLSTSQLGELIDLVQSGALTGTSGKLLLREMLARPSSQTPTERALALALLATNQEQDIDQVCAAAIAALPSEAEAYRRGHKNVLNKILGWVMKETRGRADSKQAREQLLSLLERDVEP